MSTACLSNMPRRFASIQVYFLFMWLTEYALLLSIVLAPPHSAHCDDVKNLHGSNILLQKMPSLTLLAV